ncbi:hypothetical protein SISNIDRAFT_491711 [Sistotremastrum niveocremeum HHB9708]|uniref:Uncharacterized protein n=1 Tax=Sistotremastrum niveocremeum HHB9708 TaxID=1314777 RepID=A0A164MHD3_9AGAM|nr:hypothetical protein SISNIDRAFT_491711 [Sistotremastrum niveocremeum HHB9708]
MTHTPSPLSMNQTQRLRAPTEPCSQRPASAMGSQAQDQPASSLNANRNSSTASRDPRTRPPANSPRSLGVASETKPVLKLLSTASNTPMKSVQRGDEKQTLRRGKDAGGDSGKEEDVDMDISAPSTPRASRPLHLPLNELGSPFYGDTKLSPKSTTPPCQTPTIPVKRQLQTVKKPDLKAKRIRMTPASTGIPEPSSSETGNVSISVVRELLHDTLSQFLPPNTSPSHEMAHAYMSASSRAVQMSIPPTDRLPCTPRTEPPLLPVQPTPPPSPYGDHTSQTYATVDDIRAIQYEQQKIAHKQVTRELKNLQDDIVFHERDIERLRAREERLNQELTWRSHLMQRYAPPPN